MILSKIRKDPEKYIGEKSLVRLRLFITGYILSQEEERDKERNVIFLEGFQEFIQQKFEIRYSVSYVSIIGLFHASEEHAFDTFYEQLDEFYERKKNQ